MRPCSRPGPRPRQFLAFDCPYSGWHIRRKGGWLHVVLWLGSMRWRPKRHDRKHQGGPVSSLGPLGDGPDDMAENIEQVPSRTDHADPLLNLVRCGMGRCTEGWPPEARCSPSFGATGARGLGVGGLGEWRMVDIDETLGVDDAMVE
jgi:hypothetical protein